MYKLFLLGNKLVSKSPMVQHLQHIYCFKFSRTRTIVQLLYLTAFVLHAVLFVFYAKVFLFYDKPQNPQIIPKLNGSFIGDKQYCKPILQGDVSVSMDSPSYEEITAKYPNLKPGGYFLPDDCLPVSRPTAIIIPYRDRESQLRCLLNHLHAILQRQKLEYTIIVAELAGNSTFNRGLLMNVGYLESLDLLPDKRDYQCYFFHDVDLLAEDDRAMFTCSEQAIHFSGYLDKHIYTVKYETLFGGVSAIPKFAFSLVNGYSNVYFGWGGEDDDIRRRLDQKQVPVTRVSKDTMRYKMIRHQHELTNEKNDIVELLLKNAIHRMDSDGLNSIKYRVLQRQLLPTHTLITVEISENEIYKETFGVSDKIKVAEILENSI